MKTNCLNYLAAIAGIFISEAVGAAPFSQVFNGASLNPGWVFENPNPASSETLTGSALDIDASWQNGGSDLYSGSDFSAPRLLQPVNPSLDWTIETEVEFDPANNYQGAGLLLTTTDGTITNASQFNRIEERSYTGSPYPGSNTYFRVQKQGINYTGWWSSNGVNWVQNGFVTETNQWTYFGIDVLREAWDSVQIDSSAYFIYFNANTNPLQANTFTWTGAVSSDWYNANNWSPTDVPGGPDTVILNGGTPALSQPTNVATLLVYSGTLNAGPGLVVSNTFNFLGGGINGLLTIPHGATLNVNYPANTVDLRNTTLVNNGTVNWIAGSIRGGGTVITNNASWLIQTDDQMNNGDGGQFTFYNNATFTKSTTFGTTYLYTVALDNSGTVNTATGTLNLSGGGTFGGLFNTSSNAVLNLSDGGLLNASFSEPPTASVLLSGGTFSYAPPLAFSGGGSSAFTGGTITLTNNPIPNLPLDGGTVQLSPTFQKGSITNLTLNGSTLSGDYTLTGTLTWLAGGIAGGLQINSGATLLASGSAQLTQTASITNSGHILWDGSSNWRLNAVNGVGSGSIWNLPSGIFDIQCSQQLENTYNDEFIVNQGLFRKMQDPGATSIIANFTNSGSIEVLAGTLNFNGSGTFGSSITAANGTTINFNNGGILSGAFAVGYEASMNFTSGTFTPTPTATFSGAGLAQQTGGTFTSLNNVIPNLQLNGGTLTLPAGFQGGTITNLTVNNQTLTGSNTVTGVLTINNSTLTGPLYVAVGATVNWTSGQMAGPMTIANGAIVNLLAPGGHSFGGPTTNSGTVNWIGGEARLQYNNGFFNLASGAFNIQCDQNLDTYYGQEFFNNYGLVEKSDSIGNTAFNPAFNNFGTVKVLAGQITLQNNNENQLLGGAFFVTNGATMQFNGGGYLTGTYNANAGGSFLLTGGTFTNTPTTVFTGAGSSVMNGGTITLISNLLPNLQITGGAVNLSPAFQGGEITNLTLYATLSGSNYVNGVLNLIGGTTGPLTLASNSILNINGQIGGSFLITPTAGVNSTNGFFADPFLVPSNSVFNMYGADLGGPVTNKGTVNWLNGGVRIRYNNAFYNLAGALFNIECDQTFNTFYGQESFNNYGQIIKSVTTGTTSFNLIINNYATVNADSGEIEFNNNDQNQNLGGTFLAGAAATIDFNAGGYLTGTYNAAAGGSFLLTGGTFTNTPTTTFTGAGSSVMNGGTITLISNLLPNLQITGGTLALSSAFQGGQITNLTLYATLSGSNYVNGVLNLIGQTTGPLTLASNSTLNINGTIGGPLIIPPTATINSTNSYFADPFLIPSNSVFNVYGVDLGGPVTNMGVLNWLGGGMRIRYNNTFYNSPGGLFNIECDQTWNTFYGLEVLNNSGLIRKSTTSGDTTLNLIVQNTGTVAVESGTISFGNSTVPANAGIWQLYISSGGNNGQLSFNNSVPLGGTLDVTVTNYILGLSNQFNLVTYPSQSGAFAATNLPTLGASWKLTTGSTAVTLQDTNLQTPTVSLVTPANNQVYILPSSVAFAATASDSFAPVSLVQYFAGTNLLGQATTSPYSYTWNSPAPGYYTVSALATDSHGGVATSAPVNISVFSTTHHATNYTWTGAVSSDWSTAGNWTPNNVPSALDTVFIASGTVNLATADAVSVVNFSGGTLQGPGILTVTNAFNWTGGGLAGALTIGTNATLNVAFNGSLNSATLNNYGTVIWSANNLGGSAQTVITNYGLWLCQSDNTLNCGNSAAYFVNNGTLRKTANNGTTGLNGMTFVNNGLVDAESGTISFQDGGTLAGTYNAAANAAVIYNGGSFTLNQVPTFTGGGAFNFNGGTMTLLHTAPSILNLQNGNLVLGPAFQGGSITNLTLAGSTLTGTNSVTGTMNWTAGTLNGQLTITHSGVLNLTSGNAKDFSQAALINSGQVNWTQGSLNGDNDSVITNNTLWLVTTDDQFGFGNGSSLFVNNGTFRKTAFTGTTYFRGLPLTNNGVVDAESGTIQFTVGGNLYGTYNAASGAGIDFAGGNFTLGALPNITGQGSVYFNGGNITVLTNIPANLLFDGGTITLGSAFQKSGVITNLTLRGATLSGNYSVSGSLTSLGSSINGSLTILTNAVLNLTSGQHDFSSCNFTNFGTVYWTSGEVTAGSGANFVNNGLWLAESDDALNANGLFINNSVYRKFSSGESDIDTIAFNNNGLVDVQAGLLSFQGGGIVAATYNADQFGSIDLDNGAFTSGQNPIFTGAGSSAFTGGTLTLSYDQITNLSLTGGKLTLASTFQNNGAITNLTLAGSTLLGSNLVTGELNWQAGGLNNSQLFIASNATVNILSTADKNLPGSTIINNGTVVWTGGRIRGGLNSSTTNNALWLVECDYVLNVDYGGSASFYNSGVFEKTQTFGTTTFSGPNLVNSGTLSVQSGNINFNNSSTYSQAGETLIFGASAPNVSGQLNLPGPVTFDGNLQVQFLNGYAPTLQDQLTLVTYTSETGAFASLSFPGLPAGESWNLDYGAGTLNLSVLPPPSTAGSFLISGTVKNNSGNPITGVTVYATPEAGSFTNLVQNGSFETPSIGTTAYVLYSVGATNVTGWNIIGPTNDNIALTSYNWSGPAEDGLQFMDPTGNTGGAGILQTFPTVVGASYDLIFYHGTQSPHGYNPVVGVTIGTNYLTFGETSGSGGDLDWRRVEFPFVASSNQTTLSFQELTGGNSDDSFIDNVQVVPSDYFDSVLEAVTDPNGHYQINALNASYQVGVSGLQAVGYQNVAAQTAVINNAGATANFVAQPLAGVQLYAITTAVSPATAGVATGGGSFVSGANITVTATVTNALPYTFVNWTENGIQQSASPGYSFTVLRAENLTANFALPSELITTTVNPASAGTVLGGGSFSYHTTNTLTASADFGYRFSDWTDQNNNVLGSSTSLKVVALSNGVYTANFTATNLNHFITTATLPANLTTVSGGGLYQNGQSAAISTAAFVTNGPTYYQFSQFLLNGNAFTNVNSFSWPITTALQSNLPLTAVYGGHSVRPLVADASASIANPVKATTNFILTVQFDRAMQPSTLPLVQLTNTNTLQPTVPANGAWSTTVFANDTYTTPGTTFAHGMDGINLVFVSKAIDLNGDSVALTNVLSVDVDATPPVISNVSVTPASLSAIVSWNTDKPATSQVNYGPTASYGSTSGKNSTLLTAHSMTLNSLAAVTTYHYQIISIDQAGNQTTQPDATFATIAAPDLQVTGLTISPGLSSGASATISWVDTNSGSGPTFSSWYDQIVVSNATTHQIVLNKTASYDPSVSGNIGSHAGQKISYPWTLPNGSNGAGNLFITVTANVYSNQFELTTANNSASISAASTLSAYPDLQIVNVSATPSTITSGTTVTLNWTDTNTGTGPVSGSFYDQITVTNLTTSTVIFNSQISYNELGSGPIAAHQGVNRQASFTLPNGTAGVGSLAVGFLADGGDNIYEYNAAGTAKSNNTNSLHLTSTLAVYPELEVTNITAPATVPSGGTMNVSWVDINRGTAPASNAWTEQVLLSADGTTNTTQVIASFTYSAGLAAGQSVTNTQSVSLPNFIVGNQWVVVKINALNEVFVLNRSLQENVAKQATAVVANLALAINPESFANNVANPAATATITRYGSTASALSVTLKSDNTSAATVPASVTIAANQSSATFPITAVNNNIAQGNLVADIIASASGYGNVTNTVTVTASAVPTLTVNIGATAVGVSSNATIACSVSRNTSTTSPLTVQIAANPSQLSAPTAVTIPAGASSVPFNIETVNLHLPLATYQASVSANAAGFASIAGSITIIDDQLPSLTLTFGNTVVSKGAVNPATQGTLTVSEASTQAITVLLQTPSPAITIPSSVVIPANLTNVSFPVNVVQDHLVTGDRVAVVTAQLSDANSQAPIAGATTTASITVTDDNGPTLSLSLANSTIAESGSTKATVTRNTQPTNALLVTLASSLTTAATVPASITIPTGVASTNFTVSGFNPGVPTGPRVADITASASGFGSGVAPLTVSDINIPDLVITSINVPSAGLATSNVTLSYVISNQGLGATTNTWADAVYYSTSSSGQNPFLVQDVFEASALAVGQSRTNNVTVRLPNVPGAYYFLVTANANSAVLEANYQNNTLITPAPTTNSPTYHAFIQADLTEADSPTPVPMNGYAYSALSPNQHVPNVPVNIGVIVKGTARNYTVNTDANGNFTNTFYPIPGEAGQYSLTADYPGVANPSVQATFNLFGIRITDTQENAKVFPGNPVTNQTTLINLSDLPITGIAAEPVGFPSGATAQIILTNQLGADDSANLTCIVSVGNLSSAVSAQAYIEVTCDQGAIAYLPYNLNLAPQTATLVCNPATLQSSMLIGQQTLVNFDVQNVGGAPSGPITLQIPGSPWLSAASQTNILSLAPGQSNRFIIALTPSTTLPLQVYQGSLFASAANTGLSIPFSFRAISDAIGNLTVAVQDEYTYFVAGAPLVTNAQVILNDPVTGSVVASNVTGASGTITFSNLDQGSYQMTVSALQHSTYQAPITINPGTTVNATAFISRQTVSYTWTVVPTTVVDQYQVTLQAQFETEVPIPEVVINNPFQIPVIVQGQSAEVNIQVSNEGLIAAQQISLNLPTDDPDYIYTPLSDYVDEIPAMSTVTIPVLISWKTNANNPDFVKKSYARQVAKTPPRKNDTPYYCVSVPQSSVGWGYPCGGQFHYHQTYTTIVVFPLTQACADQVSVCQGATEFNNVSGVAPSVTACQIYQCVQNCATPNACLNSIVGAACSGGDVQSAMNSANCFCPTPPPLPNLQTNQISVTPPPTSDDDDATNDDEMGSAEDPIIDPISWELTGCTPGQSGGGSGGRVPGIMTVRKLDGSPTTAAGDVCAHVTIQLDQQIALTRNAFRGTLVITDSDTNELSNVLVALSITDDNSNSVNNLFGVQPPALTGVTAVDGTGVIAANSAGTVQYTFVPTHEAAPTLPVHYNVGGTLSYVQNGNMVTITLVPQSIYVYPDPVLNLDYFLQRDVIGDDPEDPGTITPQPFNLGLMVRNVGAGAALNFTVASAQPQIVENTKGLLISFQLIGAEIGTNIVSPSLTANLGSLAPNSATVAIWEMECSLAGRFTSYAATFQQLSQLGNEQTSLIDNVNIHQMIHTFMSVRPGDDLIPDFLVNDIPNSNNYPDTVYLSDGSTNSVRVIFGAATDGPISPTHMQTTLTASMTPGWDYLEAEDPGPGYKLYRAVRSDGLDMKVPYNVWTTPLSFPASQTGALHTNLVHLVDYDGTGSYTLYYYNTNAAPPSILGLQSITPFIQSSAVPSVQITFSAPIDLSTFGASALNLSLNGGANLINSGVTVTLVTNSTYSINGLSALTASQGNYQLTVNAANVQDFGGNGVTGNAVVSTSWAEGNPPVVVQNLAAITPNPRNTPVNSITVTLDKAINASTFTYNAVSLTLNGGPNLITSGVAISSVNSTTYQINGLAALTGTAGTYTLTVNSAALQDSGGVAGTGSTSVSWTLITTGPAIVSMPTPQSPRNTVVPSETVTFSEPINAATFANANLTLTLNGGPNLITSSVAISQVTPTNFTIQNLAPLEGSDGTYVLGVNGTTISDLAGNLGVNSSNVSWVLSTHAPAAPISVAVTPITGVYPNITASNLLTLSGKVLTNNVTVQLFDQTANQILGAASLVGTNFTAPLNLSQGSHTLQVNAVDAAGNTSSNILLTVIVDQTPIGATFDAILPSPRTTPVTNLNVTFDKPMNITTIFASNVVLTFNTNTVYHPTFTLISSNVYQIGGLASLTSALGTYQLTVNFNGMRDDAGNAGAGSASTTWENLASLQPVISQVGNVSVNPGKKLKVTISATDPSSFPLNLMLASGAPAGVELENTNLTWTPECAQGTTSNYLTVWAVEAISPYYSNSMSFAVLVGDCTEAQVGSDVVQGGTTGSVPLNILATGNVTNLSFTLNFPTNRLLNWSIVPSNSAVGALVVKGLNTTQSVFTLSASSGHTLVGSSVIGSLAFQAAAGHSAFIPLSITNLAATEVNNVSVGTTFNAAGRIVLVGNEPLLEAFRTNSLGGLNLYGIPGNSYQIQKSINLDGFGNWSNYVRVPVTNLVTAIPSVPQSPGDAFYRAYSFSATPPILDLAGLSAGGKQLVFVGYGVNGTNYQLQFATNLLNPLWTPATSYTLTNSFQLLTNNPGANPSTFYRLKAQ